MVLQSACYVYRHFRCHHLHIESINEEVQGISGIEVKERIPDSVLEEADEVGEHRPRGCPEGCRGCPVKSVLP